MQKPHAHHAPFSPAPSSHWKWLTRLLPWETSPESFRVTLSPLHLCVHFLVSIFLSPWTEFVKSNWSLDSVWNTEDHHHMLRVGGQPVACLESQRGCTWLSDSYLSLCSSSGGGGGWKLYMHQVHRYSLGNCHHRWSWPSKALGYL